MMKKKIIYSCIDHVEDLLEVFLDEVEEMPVMEEIIDVQFVCHECQEMARYKLSGSEVKAKWE